MRHKPESIRDRTLKVHLNETAGQHNGFDYDKFVTMINNNVPKASIAKSFGVHRETVDKWVEVFEEER